MTPAADGYYSTFKPLRRLNGTIVGLFRGSQQIRRFHDSEVGLQSTLRCPLGRPSEETGPRLLDSTTPVRGAGSPAYSFRAAVGWHRLNDWNQRDTSPLADSAGHRR